MAALGPAGSWRVCSRRSRCAALLLLAVSLLLPVPVLMAWPPRYPGADWISAYVQVEALLLALRVVVVLRWPRDLIGWGLSAYFGAVSLVSVFVLSYLYWPSLYAVEELRWPLRFAAMTGLVLFNLALTVRRSGDGEDGEDGES